ncbi:MAG: response regulator [Janthinobacterium lividum]
MIRILIADDHLIVRQGVKQLLLDEALEFELAEAGSGTETLSMVDKGNWHLVLLDISFTDINGMEVLRRIRRKHPQLQVLMFSMYGEGEQAVRALRAGAAGYLSKAATAQEMLTAIKQVASGRKYLSAAMAETLADYIAVDADVLPHARLSHREYQTLCMLGSGKRLSDVANLLAISVKTASVYRARLLEKMHLSNNAELTYYVVNHRLVEGGVLPAGMAHA